MVEANADAGRQVEVRLAGTLTRYLRQAGADDRSETHVAPGRTVLAVCGELGFPPGQPVVAVINGRTSDLSTVLAPGDSLTLMPPIAGGGTGVADR